MKRVFLLGLLCLLLASCQPRKAQLPDQEQLAGINKAWAQASQALPINAQASSLQLSVFRAGALARLGHNHIVSAPKLQGTVYRHPELAQSQFELALQVEELAVDDPQLRAQKGEEFASVPSEADIAGTRGNMLSPGLLDSVNHPSIVVVGRNLALAADGTATIDVEVTIKDSQVLRTTPVILELSPQRVTASGAVTLSHAELGLKPFSVMLGALAVAEEMQLEFRLVAGS